MISIYCPVLTLSLKFHHMSVDTVLLVQFLRRSLFRHPAVCQDYDLVGAGYGTHAMGDNQHCLIPDKA